MAGQSVLHVLTPVIAYCEGVRPLTLLSLIGAGVLSLLTLPLLFVFLPVAIACGTAGFLLALLALPDLVATDQHGPVDPLFR